MQISVGSRFGPYEIVAPLGAGGMGEVYRAKDTRLKREVAIKILSDQASMDRSDIAGAARTPIRNGGLSRRLTIDAEINGRNKTYGSGSPPATCNGNRDSHSPRRSAKRGLNKNCRKKVSYTVSRYNRERGV